MFVGKLYIQSSCYFLSFPALFKKNCICFLRHHLLAFRLLRNFSLPQQLYNYLCASNWFELNKANNSFMIQFDGESKFLNILHSKPVRTLLHDPLYFSFCWENFALLFYGVLDDVAAHLIFLELYQKCQIII